MASTALLIGLATIGAGPPATVADAVTFRDGKVALGQVVDPDRRGSSPMILLVRRAWAEANLPDRAAAWEKAEGPLARRAQAQRRGRLVAWRRDRPAVADGGDRITGWIDRELARPADGGPDRSPLMGVRLDRADVKSIARKPRSSHRMLRLGWLSDLPDVETMPTADLARALEGRGFAPGLDAAVAVDSLLPPQPESDERWLVRRASTEVAHDPGGRLLRYQGLVLPEPAPGEAPPAGAGLAAALAWPKDLLGEPPPVDPLPGKLRELAGRGRVGAVVTRLDLAPDLSAASVETTLWVRSGGDRWTPALSRSATVRPGDLPAGAGDGLADDPQVKTVFGLVESLGFGQVPADLKRRSLVMGAATRQALGRARGALDRELEPLAIPLKAPPDRPPAAKP